MNYWYVARPNELFIDTDNVSKSIKHTRARLAGAIECSNLSVVCAMSRLSRSKNHLHTIIVLKEPFGHSMSVIANRIERATWEIVLHGDIYRGCCTIMRSIFGFDSPNILISPYEKFHDPRHRGSICSTVCRPCDDMCDCESKHNAATMKICPAAIRLRGDNRTRGFFGKPSKDPEKTLKNIWPMPNVTP